MTNKAKFFSVLSLALALLGAGCVSGDVSDDEICITRHDLQFSGTIVPLVSGSFQKTIPVDLSSQLKSLTGGLGAQDDSSINVQRLEFKAVSGVTDFDFVDVLTVTLNPPATSSADAAVLATYQRGGAHAASPFVLPTDSSINVYQLLKDGETSLTLQIQGTLPTADWTIDVTVCFAMDIKAKASL